MEDITGLVGRSTACACWLRTRLAGMFAFQPRTIYAAVGISRMVRANDMSRFARNAGDGAVRLECVCGGSTLREREHPFGSIH
jgi:hypothetical protein